MVAAVLEMVTPHLGEFEQIVDVGCGANLAYDLDLVRHGKDVVGMDFTLNFLKLAARDRLGVALVQGDALQLPFGDRAFAAAICSETIEHIEHDAAVVNELARILRPGGLLFITVPNLWNAARIIEMVRRLSPTIELMEGHVREYSPRQLRRLLRPHFKIERQIPVGFGWKGRRGSRIERMLRVPGFRRFCKSVAFVARRRPSSPA